MGNGHLQPLYFAKINIVLIYYEFYLLKFIAQCDNVCMYCYTFHPETPWHA